MMNNSRRPKGRYHAIARTCLLTLAALIALSAQEARGQWATSGNNITNTNTGNVGIGTASPTTKLDVNGTANFSGPTTVAGRGIFSIDGSNNLNLSMYNHFKINASAVLINGAFETHDNYFGVRYTPSNVLTVHIPASGNAYFNQGNVGIGTTTPPSKLTVVDGSIHLQATSLVSNGSMGDIGFGPGGGVYSGVQPRAFMRGYFQGPNWYSGSALAFFTHGGGDITANNNNLAERMRIDKDGNVGIGTTNPNGKLDVVGASGAPNYANGLTGLLRVGTANEHIEVGYVTGSRTWIQSFGAVPLHINEGGNNVIFNAGAGNVGIGTATPATKLDVAGQVKSSSGGFVFPDGTVQTTAATGSGSVNAANVSAGQFGAGNFSFPGNVDISGGLTWGGANSRTDAKNNAGAIASRSGFFEASAPVNYPAGATNWWHLIESRHSNPANNYALQIAGSFFDQNLYARKTNNDGATAWSKIVLQDSAGNISVGTSSSSTLNVTGNINVSGNINAKYQDVAEWVPSSQKLEAGTVVALDPEKSNHVLASSEAYDTRVAGVISAQPGISLGEAGEGKVLVATTGRVKVRVDATRAPIKIGDLLVTSDVQGVAMKSEPVSIGGRRMHSPGTIIGKALEPLQKGVGEILVLLSLQ
ncbi:MAG TPA: hypothetical protein VK363_19140 [Pyrinomonadaceae bacterium]|nr:hypothetical protein [Pyrinomonadaceae bacterium]